MTVLNVSNLMSLVVLKRTFSQWFPHCFSCITNLLTQFQTLRFLSLITGNTCPNLARFPTLTVRVRLLTLSLSIYLN